MCRLAAYVGPPVPLSALLYDPPHSLDRQAYAPREMLSGHVNVDGTGVAWWPPADPGGTGSTGEAGDTRGTGSTRETGEAGETGQTEPLRYVSERPPWSDPNLPTLAPRLRGRMQIAAVRSATPGVPFGPATVAPFTHGRLAGAHNGWLGRFRERTGRVLAERLPDDLHARLEAFSDSVLVFLTVVKHLDARPEAGLAEAVRAAAGEVVGVCAEADAEATLNLVVGDGERVVAVRTSHGVDANNPLAVLQGGERWRHASLIASEPLDDDEGWQSVADDQLVEVAPGGTTTRPLALGSPAA